MDNKEQWIWLPERVYPDAQTTVYNGFQDKTEGNYTVAEFQKDYQFAKKIVSVKLVFSGDTLFQLFCNEELIATGPPSVGGDYMCDESPCQDYYSYEKEISVHSNTLRIFSRVQMMPVQLCDYSKGRGGFMLYGQLIFEDGSRETVCTDETWQARRNGAYRSPDRYEDTQQEPFVQAQVIPNIWNTETAPIPVRTEREMFPDGCRIELLPGEEREVSLNLDKIYAGFLRVQAEADGLVQVEAACRELAEQMPAVCLTFCHSGEYRGFQLLSAGNILVKARNCSDAPAQITVSFITTCYPVAECAETVTDDGELNAVLRTCKHTLQYCRQTHHLDSPRHCEPLACTGDYYIETLMTLFSFGDLGLAEFDLLRTAKRMEQHDGRLFHTTYSLIWVKMLLDVYMAGGNKALLFACQKALKLLLVRFDGYIGENGLIENPPDYMFVDWIYIDGLSLHHPPKALGQTCLNMFYFGALDAAEKLYRYCDDETAAKVCAEKRDRLRTAINAQLFDREKGLYFEGLNTPTDDKLIRHWMPKNTEKRYYLKHSNILAAYFGVCDDKTAADLIERIMADGIAGDVQPYFLHYLLEAVFRCGLREKYTRLILEKWKPSVREFSKGLVEGFVPPEPGYGFDHSHAWGGTPLYSLPKALLGLEILEPGMKKVRIAPSLMGLRYAKTELMTPYGKLVCEQIAEGSPQITCPGEIGLTVAQKLGGIR